MFGVHCKVCCCVAVEVCAAARSADVLLLFDASLHGQVTCCSHLIFRCCHWQLLLFLLKENQYICCCCFMSFYNAEDVKEDACCPVTKSDNVPLLFAALLQSPNLMMPRCCLLSRYKVK